MADCESVAKLVRLFHLVSQTQGFIHNTHFASPAVLKNSPDYQSSITAYLFNSH